MITNFKIKERLCKKHSLPEVFICLSPSCSNHSFLCSTCIKKDHQHHLSHIYSTPNFLSYFTAFISKAKQSYEEDRCQPGAVGALRAKRQEVEAMHLELVERVLRRLSEEKRMLLSSLQMLERQYREREGALRKSQQQRLDIITYLLPYSLHPDLLQLKLKTSSGWALARLKQHLSQLEHLTNSFDKNHHLTLETSASTDADTHINSSLFTTLGKIIKENSNRPPLPDKIYSLAHRKLQGEPRGSTSLEKRAVSAEGRGEGRVEGRGQGRASSARQL